MTGDSARTVTTAEFFDEVVAVTRQRTASMYLYLNLEAAGQIWVQWEQPGVDHPRRYRVVDPGGAACPHCTIIEGVVRLAPVLPLDPMRTARVKYQYETVLSTGRLPSVALGRRSPLPSVSWLADCHAAAGNPHTAADCEEHGGSPLAAAPATAEAGDPLTMVEPLPLAVRQQYPDAETAIRDVTTRLRVARDWRAAAEEVAGGRAEAEATWAFLETQCVLGMPVSGIPGVLIALQPDLPTDARTAAELLAAATEKLAGAAGAGQKYENHVCLVPGTATGRMPSYAGALDLAAGAPIRSLCLPLTGKPLSRRGRGVLLLFEARHAMGVRFVPGPTKPPGYWESEAALHIFEFGLLRTPDGGYDEAVGAFVDALRKAGNLLDRPQKVLNRRQRRALAEPFGAIDDEELHLWGSVAYRNAIFLALGSQEAFAAHLRAQAD